MNGKTWIIPALIFWSWGALSFIDAEFRSLKEDPVCEHARAALDTVNARMEEKDYATQKPHMRPRHQPAQAE